MGVLLLLKITHTTTVLSTDIYPTITVCTRYLWRNTHNVLFVHMSVYLFVCLFTLILWTSRRDRWNHHWHVWMRGGRLELWRRCLSAHSIALKKTKQNNLISIVILILINQYSPSQSDILYIFASWLVINCSRLFRKMSVTPTPTGRGHCRLRIHVPGKVFETITQHCSN